MEILNLFGYANLNFSKEFSENKELDIRSQYCTFNDILDFFKIEADLQLKALYDQNSSHKLITYVSEQIKSNNKNRVFAISIEFISGEEEVPKVFYGIEKDILNKMFGGKNCKSEVKLKYGYAFYIILEIENNNKNEDDVKNVFIELTESLKKYLTKGKINETDFDSKKIVDKKISEVFKIYARIFTNASAGFHELEYTSSKAIISVCQNSIKQRYRKPLKLEVSLKNPATNNRSNLVLSQVKKLQTYLVINDYSLYFPDDVNIEAFSQYISSLKNELIQNYNRSEIISSLALKECFQFICETIDEINVLKSFGIKYIKRHENIQTNTILFCYNKYLKRNDINKWTYYFGKAIEFKRDKKDSDVAVYNYDLRDFKKELKSSIAEIRFVNYTDNGIQDIPLDTDFFNLQTTAFNQTQSLMETDEKENDRNGTTNNQKQNSANEFIQPYAKDAGPPKQTVVKTFKSTSISKIDHKENLNNEIVQNTNSNGGTNIEKSQNLKKQKNVFNVLLLGESGVGKSTFVNAFFNYMHFSTLEEAENKPNISCKVPSSFIYMDENYNKHKVEIGEADENECQIEGQSATQNAKSHSLETDDLIINIIDTPGMGDTRGIDKDQENFRNTIRYLSKYEYLNAICVLIKPNNSRFNPAFKYCFKELLSGLHKDVVQNILFCFTNTSMTSYRPGQSLPLLQSFLEEIKQISNVSIPLSQKNVFCFDNEAFRYLVIAKNGHQLPSDEKRRYKFSWEKSSGETKRMLEYLCVISVMPTEHLVLLNRSKYFLMDWAKRTVNLLSEITIALLNKSKTLTSKLDHFKDRIIDICAKISYYVKINSVSVFNDHFEGCLVELITKTRDDFYANQNLLKQYETLLLTYRSKISHDYTNNMKYEDMIKELDYLTGEAKKNLNLIN